MIKKASNYLVEEFKKNGIKVMRYDAYSSSSVYLKLDDGVIGSLRISDHLGKKHLRYRYNLIKGRGRYSEEDNGVTRYFFPMKDIYMLVDKVLYDRDGKIREFGEEKYSNYMRINRKQGKKKKKGFWSQAKYV